MEAGELFLGAVLSKAPHAAHEALLTLLPLPVQSRGKTRYRNHPGKPPGTRINSDVGNGMPRNPVPNPGDQPYRHLASPGTGLDTSPLPAGGRVAKRLARSVTSHCQSRQLQPLKAWASLAETNRSGGWEHRSHLLRLTASAAGTIGLSFRDRRLQQLEPSVSLTETDSSSCWEHRSHLLRPTAPAAAAGTKTNSSSCWTIGLGSCRQWSQLLEPMVPPPQTKVLIC
ncbi:hypothetical protein PCANC_22360 [Puccinia coronata f. sp. avenae]|uniref:Uncharacterized protein n=1 Tax=Puccinia coronata f. sp. avenae TaxID=200324 RepID=A0A2N5U1Z4_9BASI|nr:hypothetical protein PCANC_22360 [Puccinia coronata f. sp. avenae]